MTRLQNTVIVATASLVVFALLWFNPSISWLYPRCYFHEWTGWYCPGCGTTRALHQLVHGHVTAAFRFNPLAISLLPLVGYLAIRGQLSTMKTIWIWVLLAVIIAFGVLRNIPAYPFTLLAP
ncbi:MAG TPA: DUF2752 domain-containing protein [Verrucomicrobiae bacterium]|nr:DUF2752 domain-containing protein [Verrucomicrobiae bacterium]